MDLHMLSALTLYALVSSITPGPNNLMLMASGVNFGFRRTLPHMLGIGIGFTVMLALVGFGLGGIFAQFPQLETALKVVAVSYMLWLAWKITQSSAPEDGARAGGKPMTFPQAAAFQWVNPKAWIMALSAIPIYAPSQSAAQVLLVAAIFGAVNLPSVSTWALAGTLMRRWLQDPLRLKVFNWLMAGLLVLSLAPALLG
ncbi:LysE family translocator [Falsigemmobacter intermedius]|uniref:LysE family translocator n=1 Tax=Falsigemmobacter intermedius TaxID=1553448 RepID=A0A3S3YLC7_9RHOB|nr:LysE family translocator [Falsigemmobacter intermedius]RWY45523.1 LysE family translocator [Falsigemmobacter intermedius]